MKVLTLSFYYRRSLSIILALQDLLRPQSHGYLSSSPTLKVQLPKGVDSGQDVVAASSSLLD